MKKQTQGFLAFVAFGCVAAGAVGWGVWLNAAPDSARATGDISHSRYASTSVEPTQAAATIPSNAPTAPSTVTDHSTRPAQQAPVLKSDPFLAPNAFIPNASDIAVVPTRVYPPASTATATTIATVPTGIQTTNTAAAPIVAPDRQTAPEPVVSGSASTGTSTSDSPIAEEPAPQPTITGAPITEAPTTVAVPTPIDVPVSPPTLVQPEPSSEVVATSGVIEPSPVDSTETTAKEPTPVSTAPTSNRDAGTGIVSPEPVPTMMTTAAAETTATEASVPAETTAP